MPATSSHHHLTTAGGSLVFWLAGSLSMEAVMHAAANYPGTGKVAREPGWQFPHLHLIICYCY